MPDPMPSITINAVEDGDSRAAKEHAAMVAAGVLLPDGSPRYKPDVAAFHALHKRPAPAELPSTVAPEAARARLRAAHEMLAEAEAKLDKAKAACDRARQHIDEQQLALAAIGDPEGEISRHHAEGVKRAVESDRKPVIKAVPKVLADRLRKRVEIEQQIAALQSGLRLLSAELEAAQMTFVAASRAVEAAVEGVLVATGDALADQLIESEQRALDLRFKLSGLSVMWLGNGERGEPKPINLSPKLVAVMAAPGDVGRVIRPQEGDAERSRWMGLVARLRTDADATLEAM